MAQEENAFSKALKQYQERQLPRLVEQLWQIARLRRVLGAIIFGYAAPDAQEFARRVLSADGQLFPDTEDDGGLVQDGEGNFAFAIPQAKCCGPPDVIGIKLEELDNPSQMSERLAEEVYQRHGRRPNGRICRLITHTIRRASH